MISARQMLGGLVFVFVLSTAAVDAADWSQWRGVNRDGKAAGFDAPATWPAELTKKWSVPVGDGVATPSLVGDRLYVFARQNDQEVFRCLDASSGEERWSDSYPEEGTSGGARGFPGPRCSPVVTDGKVVALGVQGKLTCYDATSGEMLWRRDDFPGSVPQFNTSSSPIVVDGLCIAELGGSEDGSIVAYDLNTGEERWRWAGDGPSYGSPVLMDVAGMNVVLAPVEEHLVGINAADGELVWQIQYTQGRNTSATPITDGQTVILAGPGSGITAIAVEKKDDGLAETETWKNTDNSVQFSTPVLKDDIIYGLSNNNTLFAINAESGATAWSAPLGGAAAEQAGGGGFGGGGRGGFGRGGERGDRGARGNREGGEDRGDRSTRDNRSDRDRDGVRLVAAEEVVPDQAATPPAEGEQAEQRRGDDERRGRRGFGRGRGGRRGGGGRGGYGSIVDAGSVLMVLTPAAELVVFEPSESEFKVLARYKVSGTPIYAHPVPSDNRIYVKDQENVTLYTVD
jgi:outer membrane protein assembly factor BamB